MGSMFQALSSPLMRLAAKYQADVRKKERVGV
jgi:hypothetical protein